MRAALVLLAALAFAAPAAAQTPVLEQAAEGLRTDSVYVHSRTNTLSEEEADALRTQIEEEGAGPLFIAILPSSASREAGGSAAGVAVRLGELLREDGVYAVLVGNQFRAVSNDLARDQAGALATRAFLTHNADGVAAVLADFVSRVADVRSGAASANEEGGDGGGFPYWLLAVGGAIAAVLRFPGLPAPAAARA